ncbi:MAG: lipid-A-disaccharide synthase [bacterium]
MKIFVSAGEVSGDVHGSYLVKELKKLKPDAVFFGLGGEKLAEAGVDIRFNITRRGSIGILEALPNIIPIFSVFQKVKKLLLQEKPDLVILIDSQGINFPIANFCKKIGLKTVYYIAPQEWLWGTPRGVKKVADAVGLIVAIFEREYESYKKAGANVIFFGHPLIDIVNPSPNGSTGLRRDQSSRSPSQPSRALPRDSHLPTPNVISLCPGSRTHEIKNLLPILLKSAELIQKEIPDAHFIIPAASHDSYKIINSFICNLSFDICHLQALESASYDALASSTLALCTSGTINLEASLLGTPNIMIYKLSPLTYWIGKHILKIDKKLKYFSMPNILLDKKVIPELVMADANPEKIAAEALSILKYPDRSAKMKASFEQLKTLLGAPGVIAKTAKAILSLSF